LNILVQHPGRQFKAIEGRRTPFTTPDFDNKLDSDVVDVIIEQDDRVFMTMVHPVDPHHFVCASSTVSGRLVEASAKNSKPKCFEDIVPTSLHA
jgi:hypothetical protein